MAKVNLEDIMNAIVTARSVLRNARFVSALEIFALAIVMGAAGPVACGGGAYTDGDGAGDTQGKGADDGSGNGSGTDKGDGTGNGDGTDNGDSSSTSNSSSSGNQITGSACEVNADCAKYENECRSATCVNFVCEATNVKEGIKLKAQVGGDCHVNVCDVIGDVVELIDDADVPESNLVCQVGTCVDGIVTNVTSLTGTSCANGVCNAVGNCVECLLDGDCGDGTCSPLGICLGLKLSCSDGVKNGDETDVDCGGTCGSCVKGGGCFEADDCLAKVCVKLPGVALGVCL